MPSTFSPLRYPGGKSQLASYVSYLLTKNNINGTYIEPFAGGAGVAIRLLLDDNINSIWINDYDKAIYSVWYSILYHPKQLIELIEKVPFDYYSGHYMSKEFSIAFWKEQKKIYSENKTHQNSIELGFSTLFLNRTNRSGIIKGGPIGGFNQNGVSQIYSRFNKQTLIKKINLIHDQRDRIKLTRKDTIKLIPEIQKQVDSKNSFIFFDPPYFEQGKNLYYSSFDKHGHETLANAILTLSDFKWITTYDKSQQISALYQSNKKNFEYDIRYSANNKKRGHAPELLFASPSLQIDSYDSVNLLPIK